MSKEKQIEEMVKELRTVWIVDWEGNPHELHEKLWDDELENIAIELYNIGYRKQSETASEIIDEIIDALQGEKDAEEKLVSNAWDASDTVGYHIHQYAEEKLDTLIIALSIYKREYTQEQNIGKTITVPKYKYTQN